MNVGKIFQRGNIGVLPSFLQVRYAKIKKRPSRSNSELTDMALWRKERGLYSNPNKFGPLTNLPDFSFMDGRPAPLSLNLKKRIEKQKEYAETIVRLSAEVDFAKERYRQKQEANEQQRKQRISSKLKPKGVALLKNS